MFSIGTVAAYSAKYSALVAYKLPELFHSTNVFPRITIIDIIADGRRDARLMRVRRDAGAFDRKGLQSFASDAVSSRTNDVHRTTDAARPGKAAVSGILKKTPASVSSMRQGETL